EGPPLTRSRLDRWRRVLIESCKQSGRRRLPILGSIERLPDVPGGVIAFLADPRQAMPLIARLGQPRPDACWVAVGPESGLDDAELDDAVSRGWQPVSLGPRVLRTETAGLVATAVIQSCWGDLA
ncbi:MAG: RsmE family RNA methyltransferase, partial [Acidobacteriota bacterium]|nr:RsmE family RNA methyltransferase [Acidobacteriota bacterium]